ncbi:MAG: BamA/TamA family outer membrane protein, partial [Candidatus Kapabacteria bacterium]|nr:BamA/TamA family outer membrane protein [Candidatus Kapabacteria bacterium]
GGLMANNPIEQTDEFNPDIVLAVNTTSPLLGSSELNKPWNVADQVVSLMMLEFNKRQQGLSDVILTPDIGSHSNSDFTNLDSLIRKGRECYRSAANDIRRRYDNLLDSSVSRMIDSSVPSSFRRLPLLLDDVLANISSLMPGQANRMDIQTVVRTALVNNTVQSIRFTVRGDTLSCAAIPFPLVRDVVVESIDTARLPKSRLFQPMRDDTLLQPFRGKPATNALRTTLRESLTRHFRTRGNSFATIVSMRYDTASQCIRCITDDAPLRSILIRGNSAATDLYIRRELGFDEGDYLNVESVVRGWENILNTDLFSDVSVQLRRLHEQNSGVAMKLTVHENSNQALRIGGRIDNERNTQGTLDFIQENIFSSGVRMDLRVGGGSRNSIGLLRFDIPRILNTFWTAALNGYWNARNVYLYNSAGDLPRNQFDRFRNGEYNEQRAGVSILFGRQIQTDGRIAIVARYEQQRAFRFGEFNPGERNFRPLGAVSFSSIFDTEDRADFPVRGRVISLQMERTFLTNDDALQFTKFEARIRSTWSFGAHTFRPSLHIGFAESTLPLPEFFNFGGQDGFFGLREEDERGRQLFLGQFEYRVKSPVNILFDTYVSLRYDLGRVWSNIETIQLANLKHGIGATIALDTPLGPAKFSLGRSFFFLDDPETVVTGPLIAYFSIGLRIQ